VQKGKRAKGHEQGIAGKYNQGKKPKRLSIEQIKSSAYDMSKIRTNDCPPVYQA
jgi:hypothetical protein